MKQQVHLGTDLGIVSKEAVKQIRMLITDLNRSIRTIDAAIETKERRPRREIAKALELRRSNLIATIGSLEDHLELVENLRSHGYGASEFHPTQGTSSRYGPHPV